MRSIIRAFLKYKEYVLLAIIAVAAGLVFGIAYFLKEQFSAVMTVESFWHGTIYLNLQVY